MELFIKNLLGIRCMMIVKFELEKSGLNCYELELGKVVTKEVPASEQIGKFRIGLLSSGLELLENKKNILIKKIKNVIIEQFIIKQRIKRVKELICWDEFTLTENFWRRHYISVVPLSTQFKKVSGLNPTCFKQMRLSHIGLESVRSYKYFQNCITSILDTRRRFVTS